jgi:hypothetical protein
MDPLFALAMQGSSTIICCILHQQLANLANQDIKQAMLPIIMPWPMTLTPTTEAIRRENHAKKTFYKEKNYHHDLGGHVRCKDSITIKKA